MRGDATTSWRINERRQRGERQREAEVVQREVTGQPAGENERGEVEATRQEAAARQERHNDR